MPNSLKAPNLPRARLGNDEHGLVFPVLGFIYKLRHPRIGPAIIRKNRLDGIAALGCAVQVENDRDGSAFALVLIRQVDAIVHGSERRVGIGLIGKRSAAKRDDSGSHKQQGCQENAVLFFHVCVCSEGGNNRPMSFP